MSSDKKYFFLGINMEYVIKQNKVNWIERNSMNPTKYAMQQWLDKLDAHLIEIESRWGVNRLPKLVSQNMADKWARQMDKINAAIQSSDIGVFPELVDGAIRGCAAMEAEAKTLGHAPHDAPLCWTVETPKGNTLAIVRHSKDASLLQGNGQNVLIYTIKEIASIIDGVQLVNRIDSVEHKTMTLSEFDFTKGDDVVF